MIINILIGCNNSAFLQSNTCSLHNVFQKPGIGETIAAVIFHFYWCA